MQKKDDVPDGQGFEAHEDGLLLVVALLEDCDDDEAFISNITRQIDYIKNSNVAIWLKEHPAGYLPHLSAPPNNTRPIQNLHRLWMGIRQHSYHFI
eukprot:8931212-Ditylum_brightwellii.AAC.1